MRLTFSGCVFDSGTRQVTGRGGDVLPISPKAFQLLEALIAVRPNAVSKEDLHAMLWPGTFVADANLPNLVGELRAGLGDDSKNPHIIRTVQRFGYAFSARAKAVGESHASRSARGISCRLLWDGLEVRLEPGENILGRDAEATAWIDDPGVSRRHARIVVEGNDATLQDLGSKNGTKLRGRRIHAPARLEDRDVIQIGPAKMIVRILRPTGPTRTAADESPGS